MLTLFKKKLNNLRVKSKILIIAGSDSSGGAGIQADIKTATCLGSYSMTALTAVTIQNTYGVKSVVSIPANEIYNQIIHTTKDIKPDAIKIGMLHSTQVINQVYKSLNKIKIKTVKCVDEILSETLENKIEPLIDIKPEIGQKIKNDQIKPSTQTH